jgi:hypothetical protein
MLFEKINSGSYFLLNYSDITNNLNDYNKNTDDIINLNLINLDKFEKLELGYSNIIRFDKNRIIGIKNNNDNDCSLDVYNIKTKKVETSIKLNSKGKNYKIYYKYNIILLINDAQIYIIDSKKFRIIKEIKSKPEPEKKDNDSKRNYSVWGYSNYEDPFVEELEKYHK